MKIITDINMPKSNGHYSQCIEHNGILYLSGQLPILQEDRNIPKTIEEQTLLVLNNIDTILKVAGSNKNNILQVSIYVSNIKLWDKVDEVYSRFFEHHKPVRSIIPTRELHFGCLIEVEVTAILNN
ncbi:RidA family protein [Formosa sp. L2A11]|uniref:RidA family protein n=1 Tax=Formosa sp. L2A11 TaxID=2686363 RepID=UPI00131BBE36|nr:RidA family protein [Formosa sp. L2A11]